jgi:hypothetical protein
MQVRDGSGYRGRRGADPALRSVRMVIDAAAAILLLAAAACGSLPPAAAPAGFGVSLSADPLTGTAPLLVHFVASPSAGGTPAVEWQFGDGAVLFGNDTPSLSPSHWYETTGAFDAIVTIREGGEVAETNLTVHVASALVTVRVDASVTAGPAPLTVFFNGTPSGGTGTYIEFVWSFGDGGTGSGPQVRYTFLRDGSFRVILNVTDNDGHVGSGSVWVNVSDPAHGPALTPSSGWNAGLVTNWPYAVAGLLAIGGLVVVSRHRHRLPAAAPESELPEGTAHRGPLVEPSGGGDATSIGVLSANAAGPLALEQGLPSGTSGPPRGIKDVSDQLILRLARLGVLGPDDVPTLDRTQRGLAEALGVGQNVVSKVLARLVAAEVVVVATRHVQGQPRRMKAYRLTPHGERLASTLRHRSNSGSVRGPG